MAAGVKFCRKCGAPVKVAQTLSASSEITGGPASSDSTDSRTRVATRESTPTEESLPLYSIQKTSDEVIRSQGEKVKIGLFGLEGKRTLFGKKPEEYIALESASWSERVFVRIRGTYSSTYVVDSVFPLDVGKETFEVEIGGDKKFKVGEGVLSLPVRLRKLNWNEITSCFNEKGEDVENIFPPRSELQLRRTVQPPLTIENVQRLLDSALEWARRGLLTSRSKSKSEGGIIEKENVGVSDHEVILLPSCVLTYANKKTGEKKSLAYESLRRTLTPAT